MTGVDLAKFRKSCAKTDLKIKWVNGDSQLAASLTKNYEQAQMDLFYKLGGRWRLNFDETYTSMRKYQQSEITALEDGQKYDLMRMHQKYCLMRRVRSVKTIQSRRVPPVRVPERVG